MIVDLPDTSTAAITKRMINLRDSSGTILNRVLNLLVVVDKDADVEAAIVTSREATREHPCRVLVMIPMGGRGAPRLDGQIRVGGDAGASEIIVLRMYGELSRHADSVALALLLPDSPVVAWWPGDGPTNPSADPLGRLAQRRLVDSSHAPKPIQRLYQRAPYDTTLDTDLGWARTTRWRSVLAAALDQEPYAAVERVVVVGSPDSPSNELLAAWLGVKLQCPVTVVHTQKGDGIVGVKLFRQNGSDVTLVRPDNSSAVLTQPGQPDRRINLARRPDREVISEELRRLDPDEVYEEVVRKGLPLLKRSGRHALDVAVERGEFITLRKALQLLRVIAERDRRAAQALGQTVEDSPGQPIAPAPSPSGPSLEAPATKKVAPKKPVKKKAAKKKAAKTAKVGK